MKKVIVLVLSYLLAVSCSGDKKTYQMGGIAKFLPQNTVLMLKASSLKRLYQSFSVTGDSFFGESIPWADDAKTILGFNPYNIKDLQDQGLDITKEIGVLLSELEFKENDEPAVTILFFIPVTDGKKLLTTIKDLLGKKAPGVKIADDAGITVIDGGGKNKQLYIAEKDSYLFFALSSKGNGKSLIQSVLSGKSSLTESKSYKDVARLTDSSQDLFAFADMNQITANNLDVIKKSFSDLNRYSPGVDMSKFLDYLKDYDGLGLSVDLKSSDLMSHLTLNLKPSSETLKLYKDITYNKKTVLGVNDTAALFISVGFNFSEYYKILVKTLGGAVPIQTGVKAINKKYNLDVEKDVIENIAGNFNVCTYDGSSISKFKHNTIFTVSIKDESKIKEVINKIRKKLPSTYQQMFTEEKVGSVDAYKLNAIFFQIYIGMKDGNLIIATGKPMFEKAINGDPSKGFLNKFKDKSLAKTLGGKSESIVYINVDEVYKAIKNFGVLPRFGGQEGEKVNDVVKQFKYLLLSSEIVKNTMSAHFIVKTNFKKSFLEGIKDIKDSLEKLSRMNESTEKLDIPQPVESDDKQAVKDLKEPNPLDGLKDADRVKVPEKQSVTPDAKGQSDKLLPKKQSKKANKKQDHKEKQ